MAVEIGERIADGDDIDHAGCRSQQTDERLRRLHDPAAAAGDSRDVANELQSVAKPLLGMDQDGLSGERFPRPQRPVETALVAGDGKPPLVFAPALVESLGREQGVGAVEMRLGIIRRQDQRGQRASASEYPPWRSSAIPRLLWVSARFGCCAST